jgi:argininosuccinate lyase
VEGLGVKRELDRGEFTFDDSLEDIHMHIEARLLQVAGRWPRSCTPPAAATIRWPWTCACTCGMRPAGPLIWLHAAATVLVDLAEAHLDVVMPGYTHTQRAQPVLLAHHMMAYYEMFTRDQARFSDCLERIDVMPLGAAALAGTTYPIDGRNFTGRIAGFSRVSANSMDAVSDRDFAMEFLAAPASAWFI